MEASESEMHTKDETGKAYVRRDRRHPAIDLARCSHGRVTVGQVFSSQRNLILLDGGGAISVLS